MWGAGIVIGVMLVLSVILWFMGWRPVNTQKGFLLVSKADWDALLLDFHRVRDLTQRSGHICNLRKEGYRVVDKIDSRLGEASRRMKKIEVLG